MNAYSTADDLTAESQSTKAPNLTAFNMNIPGSIMNTFSIYSLTRQLRCQAVIPLAFSVEMNTLNSISAPVEKESRKQCIILEIVSSALTGSKI